MEASTKSEAKEKEIGAGSLISDFPDRSISASEMRDQPSISPAHIKGAHSKTGTLLSGMLSGWGLNESRHEALPSWHCGVQPGHLQQGRERI